MKVWPQELADEYLQRICACSQPVKQIDADWEWLSALKKLHEETGALDVFGLYMHRPRQNGLAAVYRFVRQERTPAEFLDEAHRVAGDDYLKILQSAGLVKEVPQPNTDQVRHEIELELLKGALPLVGADTSLAETCNAVTLVASTIWFRYIEALHSFVGLPPVSELRDAVIKLNATEEDILKADSFDRYAIENEEERSKLEALLKGKG